MTLAARPGGVRPGRRGGAGAALTTLALAACGGGAAGGSAPASGPASGLADARAAWAAAGIDDYDLTIARSCLCETAGSVRVTVRDGVPVEVVGTPPGALAPDATPPPGTPTSVEALFGLVAREQARADRVSVRYDSTGVPLVIDVDRLEEAVDDEVSISVGFTRIP